VNDKKHPFFSIKKGAYSGRFFICFTLLSTFLTNQAYSTTQSSCDLDSSDETVAVTQVIDGDTVILKDDRHVRLIGINTPEIGRNGKLSEQGADAARKYLLSLLQENKEVFLKYDIQQFDRYRRTLAHLFLADGKKHSSQLVGGRISDTADHSTQLEISRLLPASFKSGNDFTTRPMGIRPI